MFRKVPSFSVKVVLGKIKSILCKEEDEWGVCATIKELRSNSLLKTLLYESKPTQ